MSGRRALVTGASSGIGAATARAFVAEGAQVLLMGRRRAPLDALATELGDAVSVFAGDVADREEAGEAVSTAIECFGGLDAVVNSAGVAWPETLEDMDPAHWELTIGVNLSGSFYVGAAAGLHMRAAGGGTIVNVASDLAVQGRSMYVSYCAAKAGVLGLTRSLAAELAPVVTVNAICPGPVDTPMLAAEFEMLGDPEERRAESIAHVPLKRLAHPDEVAAGILYLTADAPFATGATLELDGGTTLA
jgi:NAD(P)-dependent dehydrogenase (short-subunit alcohol dehydrogenase family)